MPVLEGQLGDAGAHCPRTDHADDRCRVALRSNDQIVLKLSNG